MVQNLHIKSMVMARLFSFTLLLVVFLISSPSWAKTYYTGKGGCSGSGSGSSSQPFCTIQQGISALNAGDTLLVQAGTYPEQVKVNRSGAAGKPIVIQAAPGAAPVVEGKGSDFWEQGLINIQSQDHIVLRGLVVQNSPYYCLSISNASDVVVEKLVVDFCEHGGIVFDQGSDNVKALGNEVKGTDQCGQGCGTHEAITFSETTNFVAAGNHVHHGVKEGIDAKDGADNGEIYDNTVAHMGQVGIYLNHATNVKIYKNRVHDNGASAFQVAVGDLAMGSSVTDGNEIYQNEAWDNAYCGVEFWAEGSGEMSNNKIYNNVFHNNGHYGVQLSDDSGQVYGNVIRNNIISKNGLGGIVGDAVDSNTISHNLFFKTGATGGSSKVSGDPLFVNVASGDFSLKKGSPAIDTGYDMALPKVGKPDIGAHEYGYTPPAQQQDSGPGPGGSDAAAPSVDGGVPGGDHMTSGADGGPDSFEWPSDNAGTNSGAPGALTGGCQVGSCRGVMAPLVIFLVMALLMVGRRR